MFKGYRLTRISNDAKEAEEDPITTMVEAKKMENGANDEKWSVKLDNAAKETGEMAWIYWYNKSIEGFPPVADGNWPLDAGKTRK